MADADDEANSVHHKMPRADMVLAMSALGRKPSLMATNPVKASQAFRFRPEADTANA